MSNWINLLEVVYPIGSIYQSTKSTSSSQSIGGNLITTCHLIISFIFGRESFLVPEEVLSDDL